MVCRIVLPLRLVVLAGLLPLTAGLVTLGCYVGLDGEGASFSAGELSGDDSDSDSGDDSDAGSAGNSDSDDSEGTTGGEGESASGAISATEGGDDSDSGDEPTGGDSTTSTTGDDPTTSDSGDDSTTSTTGDDSTTSTTGDDPTTSGGSTSGGMMGEYCDDQNNWMASWAALEAEVVEIVNQRRSEGANCGTKGSFGAAGPLTMHPLLRCAARLHSKDMVVRSFFSHDNPDGETPWDRIAKTGYGGYSTAGENIAAGSGTAAGVVQQWMDSDGHCANIMNPAFNEIGVGYYPGGQYGHYWTQKFTKK